MFPQTQNTEYISGYVKIDEHLKLLEISGEINKILQIDEFDPDESFLHIIEVLKKNTRSFFKQEILPAIKARQIRNFSLDRKKTILNVTVTSLSSGLTIISLEEIHAAISIDYQSLPEKLQDLIIRINPDIQVSYISKKCYSKLGIKAANVKGKSIEEIGLFGDQTANVVQLINQAFQLQKKIKENISLKKPDGTTWWNMTFIPEIDPANHQQSVLIILKNVSRLVKTEEKLQDSEQRFLLATEAADLGIWDYIVGTGKTFYSRRWKSMLGYYPDEIQDNYSAWLDMIHPL
ncbi:MAG: PAS domain S-box protein, partial [Bacteroidota bacterium]|nr:PAS domain S-box protein [Bacteroidota bacterium]